MRKQTFKLAMFVLGIGLMTVSCTYKGECKCGSISVEDEYDNKDDYNDAKAACELMDCEWRKKL